MKKFIFIILLFASFSSFAQKEAEIAYEIDDINIVTEGIAYSKTTDHFYIGSILDTKILKINAKTGEWSDLMTSDVAAMRFCGMIVDDERNYLWSCGSITLEGRRTTAVVKLDLISGDLIDIYSPQDTSLAYAFNDVALDKNGNLYVTCTGNQHVFKVDQKSNKLELFFEDDDMLQPNGITISDNQKYLYVNCRNGIRVIDMINKKLVNQANEQNSITHDGLKFWNNSLIAVKHFWPEHKPGILYQYQLNDEGSKLVDKKKLIENHPSFALPTTSVIRNGEVYLISTSYLHNADWSNNTFKNPDLKGNMIIIKTKIPDVW